jgi:hypothetical protein
MGELSLFLEVGREIMATRGVEKSEPSFDRAERSVGPFEKRPGVIIEVAGRVEGDEPGECFGRS